MIANTRKLIWCFFFFLGPTFFHSCSLLYNQLWYLLEFWTWVLRAASSFHCYFSLTSYRYPPLCVWFKHFVNVLWHFLRGRRAPIPFSQQARSRHSKMLWTFKKQYHMYLSVCLWKHKWTFFSSWVIRYKVVPVLFYKSALSSSLLLSGQLSLCLLYLLSGLVKDLSGQPSDWPLGPAGGCSYIDPEWYHI